MRLFLGSLKICILYLLLEFVAPKPARKKQKRKKQNRKLWFITIILAILEFIFKVELSRKILFRE